ncbi:hypothetical protein L6452_01290 [Arctium lappa]|uniref:Uncharacterized protein n=1 Tax=Arctium lappa TaxID=4217 RepID=A0ACB9FGG7_ARCLA|nr:hypothetical protein L6452_01290 [Arctium lappa]
MQRNPKAKTPESSGIQILMRNTHKDVPTTAHNNAKGKDGNKRFPSVVRIKVKGKNCGIPDYNSDSDFEDQNREVGEGSTARNKPAKGKNKEKKYKKDSPQPTNVMKAIQASSDAGQTSNNINANIKQDLPSTEHNEEGDTAIKKFGLLMRMKVDAQTVIMKEKEKFPLDSIFERYEDKLAILFNETTFRGSTKSKQATTSLVGCKQATNHNNQSPHEENVEVLCTPKKLNFDNIES